jgi:hypothetical protein
MPALVKGRWIVELVSVNFVNINEKDKQMSAFNPENKDKLTIGETFAQARKAETKEEAKRYLDDYATHIARLSAFNIESALDIARENIGHFAGYYDKETYLRIQELFEVRHPVFGNEYTEPAEAFEAGENVGVIGIGQAGINFAPVHSSGQRK